MWIFFLLINRLDHQIPLKQNNRKQQKIHLLVIWTCFDSQGIRLLQCKSNNVNINFRNEGKMTVIFFRKKTTIFPYFLNWKTREKEFIVQLFFCYNMVSLRRCPQEWSKSKRRKGVYPLGPFNKGGKIQTKQLCSNFRAIFAQHCVQLWLVALLVPVCVIGHHFSKQSLSGTIDMTFQYVLSWENRLFTLAV